jgi:hypothetical protein
MWCREALRNGTAYDGWMPTGRFSQAQCAPWRQEMRYVPRRGSCRWTQTPWRVSLASNPLVWKHQRVPEPLPTAKPTPRDRCAAHGAPWGPDDGGRPHRAWLDDPCMAALSRLRSIPGSMACYCVPMLALGCVSSRQLRDTTLNRRNDNMFHYIPFVAQRVSGASGFSAPQIRPLPVAHVCRTGAGILAYRSATSLRLASVSPSM